MRRSSARSKTSAKAPPLRVVEPRTPSDGTPRAALSTETLAALAPAAEHLLRAVSEVVAAAQVAIDLIPEETRARSRWSLRSAGAAMSLLARLAESGADRARRTARETLKKETAREILAALAVRAQTLEGSAADALVTVQSAVASALGVDPLPSRAKPEPKKDAPRRPRAKRKLRRIPPVPLAAEDADE